MRYPAPRMMHYTVYTQIVSATPRARHLLPDLIPKDYQAYTGKWDHVSAMCRLTVAQECGFAGEQPESNRFRYIMGLAMLQPKEARLTLHPTQTIKVTNE